MLSYHNLHSSSMNHIHQFRIILSTHNLCSWKMNHVHKIFNLSLKLLISIQILFEVFFKKESESLSSHRDYLNHHISLKKNVKSIFDLIYNLSKLELKVLKEYIQDKLKKEFIHSFISSFDFSILFIKKLDDS